MKPPHHLTSLQLEKSTHRLIKKIAKQEDRTVRSVLKRMTVMYQNIHQDHGSLVEDRRR